MKRLTDLSEIKTAVARYLELSEHFKNSYCFSSPATASGRRSYEEQHSMSAVEFEICGQAWTLSFIVYCSCANVYVSKQVTRNGLKTDIKRLKKLQVDLCGPQITLDEFLTQH